MKTALAIGNARFTSGHVRCGGFDETFAANRCNAQSIRRVAMGSCKSVASAAGKAPSTHKKVEKSPCGARRHTDGLA
jgi:hypothetical protein